MALPSREEVRKGVAAVFADTAALREAVGNVQLPDALSKWLGRLRLLYGVPFNYLVPDEGMLPPESIRFFYVDMSWVDALIDGAFSIGRNLAVGHTTSSMALDQATFPAVKAQAAAGSAQLRSRTLGIAAPEVSLKVVSGFLLRSSLVAAYKNLGVNVYPEGGTPDLAPGKIRLLPLLRLEALGPHSDTLICLVDGDAYRVDVHEAPEHLHYAIDSYGTNPLSAKKTISLFTKSGSTITFGTTQKEIDISGTGCLRSSSPRTFNMQKLAATIGAAQNPPVQTLDAAEMGFEMTEGVGMVSFRKRTGT